VDQEIRNKEYTRIVEDHLNRVRPQGKDSTCNNDVYFLYLKWFYNKKCNEELSLNALGKSKLFDEWISEKFGNLPNHCLHIRAAFFTWRSQKWVSFGG